MPEKDPTTWTATTWVLALGMAFGGGVVNWYAKVKRGHTRAFNIIELFNVMLTKGLIAESDIPQPARDKLAQRSELRSKLA